MKLTKNSMLVGFMCFVLAAPFAVTVVILQNKCANLNQEIKSLKTMWDIYRLREENTKPNPFWPWHNYNRHNPSPELGKMVIIHDEE